jgi:hypothetical protein
MRKAQSRYTTANRPSCRIETNGLTQLVIERSLMRHCTDMALLTDSTSEGLNIIRADQVVLAIAAIFYEPAP